MSGADAAPDAPCAASVQLNSHCVVFDEDVVENTRNVVMCGSEQATQRYASEMRDASNATLVATKKTRTAPLDLHMDS